MNIEKLKQRLFYDPKTGVFTWSETIKNQRKGTIAGQLTKDGYIRINVDGKKILAHRLAWLYVYGELPNGNLDHKDRNKQNNSISNLRIASYKENAQNRGNSLGFSWHSKSQAFAARITVEGKQIGLGYHKTMLDARAAYLRARAIHHPFKT